MALNQYITINQTVTLGGDMSIIAVGHEKGGVGKSTILVNIAGLMAINGYDVCIVDADKQLTSMRWTQYREERDDVPSITCVSASGNIRPTLIDLARRYDHVLVDCAGRDSNELRSAMLAADVLLAPFRPSQADIDTIPNLSELIDTALMYNERLTAIGVMNFCPVLPNLKDADRAAEALADFTNIKLSPVRICERQGYRDSYAGGHCIEEWQKITGKASDKKAADEIRWITKEILNNA